MISSPDKLLPVDIYDAEKDLCELIKYRKTNKPQPSKWLLHRQVNVEMRHCFSASYSEMIIF